MYFLRKQMERALPRETNFGNLIVDIMERFDGCALTGENTEEIQIDHFVSISTGNGGNVAGNCIPLHRELNLSKSDRNPFEWYDRVKDVFAIDNERWNDLILYLAIRNDMSVNEFKQYVDWCYQNKRNINQVRNDPRYSIYIWKDLKEVK